MIGAGDTAGLGSYFAVDLYRHLAGVPMLLAISAYSLHAADRLPQPWLFNLIDNAVLQQRRIKILFPMALSMQLFSKRCDQK